MAGVDGKPGSYEQHCREVEQHIVERARSNGGEYRLSMGELAAAVRLTEQGVGHWEQRHPFVATFVLDEASA